MIQLVVAGVLCFLLDRICKGWAASFAQNPAVRAAAPRIIFVRVSRRSYNRRGARVQFVLMGTAALLSTIAFVDLTPNLNDLTRVGLGVALGGAAGNLFEIVRYRAVTDFVDLGWWPVFNVADVCIVTGLIVVFIAL